MNLQSKVVVSYFIIALVVWIFRSFSRKQLNSGQALLWLILLTGCEALTVAPSSFVDSLSRLWGNLVPVSWITFTGMVFLIYCLLSQSVQLNDLQSKIAQLARHDAFLEQRLRELEIQKAADPTEAS